MFSVAIFGGNTLDGSALDPGERVIGVALFGGLELDFAGCTETPPVDVLVIALFGGATVRVRPEQEVRLSGFSLFGGRKVEPRPLPPSRGAGTVPAHVEDDFELPLEITAVSIFGGVDVKRGRRAGVGQ